MLTQTDWQLTWQRLGLGCPVEVFDELLRRYAEPHRAYHTRQHLRECFDHLQSVRHLANRPGEVELAIWFHDAVYDPRRQDNEERSRDLAVDVLTRQGAASEVVDRVSNLILATRHTATPKDHDERLLVDIDLAILGADAARFDEYESQILREYEWVPWPDYCAGRSRILRQFLDRPRIYLIEWFHQRFEQQARTSLRESIRRLGMGPDPSIQSTP